MEAEVLKGTPMTVMPEARDEMPRPPIGIGVSIGPGILGVRVDARWLDIDPPLADRCGLIIAMQEVAGSLEDTEDDP